MSEGRASPLAFHMARCHMDARLLSAHTGIWSLRIRRHGADGWTTVGISAPSALTRIQAGVDHFLSCVLERRQPCARVADGVRALEVAQAAYQSVVEDRFVACGPGGVSRSRGCSASG